MASSRTRATVSQQQGSLPNESATSRKQKTPNLQNDQALEEHIMSRPAKRPRASDASSASNTQENGQSPETRDHEDQLDGVEAMMNQFIPTPASLPATQRGGRAPRTNNAAVKAEGTTTAGQSRGPAAANKQTKATRRKRYVDPQAGADKIEFDTQGTPDPASAVQPDGRKRRAGPATIAGAASADAEGDPVSEDNDLQMDNAETNLGQQRKARQAKQSNKKSSEIVIPTAQMSTQHQPQPPPGGEPRPNATTDEINSQVNNTSTEHGREERASAAEYLQNVKAEAKQATRRASGLIPKITQTRVAWSYEETDALLEYIRTLGCSWSRIKKHDETQGGRILHQRHQGDIKDKARNMKFDYLKARWTLPGGFEDIPIPRPMIEKLHSMGIAYTQTQTRKPRD